MVVVYFPSDTPTPHPPESFIILQGGQRAQNIRDFLVIETHEYIHENVH